MIRGAAMATPSAPRDSASGAVGGGAPGLEPGALLDSVERGASRLEAAADALYHAVKKAADAERAYEEAFEKELLAIYHRAQDSGERMPAEDVRRAIAHDNVEDGVYAAHLMAKAELAAQEKTFRGLSAAVSARQSVLKAITGGSG